MKIKNHVVIEFKLPVMYKLFFNEGIHIILDMYEIYALHFDTV